MRICLIELVLDLPRSVLAKAMYRKPDWKDIARSAVLSEPDGREAAVVAACEAAAALSPPPDLVVFGLWTYTNRASRRVVNALRKLSSNRVVVAELVSDEDQHQKHGMTRVWTDERLQYFRQELSDKNEAAQLLKSGGMGSTLLTNPASRVLQYGDWKAFLLLCGEVNLVRNQSIPTSLKWTIADCDVVINPGHTLCTIKAMSLKRDYLGALTKRGQLVHVANRHIPSVSRKDMLASFRGTSTPYFSHLLSKCRETVAIHPAGNPIRMHNDGSKFRLFTVDV